MLPWLQGLLLTMVMLLDVDSQQTLLLGCHQTLRQPRRAFKGHVLLLACWWLLVLLCRW